MHFASKSHKDPKILGTGLGEHEVHLIVYLCSEFAEMVEAAKNPQDWLGNKVPKWNDRRVKKKPVQAGVSYTSVSGPADRLSGVRPSSRRPRWLADRTSALADVERAESVAAHLSLTAEDARAHFLHGNLLFPRPFEPRSGATKA
jgi:hypothetical protein